MGKRFAFVILILATLLLWCDNSFAIGYLGQLRYATHNARIFSAETWDAKLLWHATFFSDAFRKDYDQKHIEVNHLNDADAASFLAGEELRQRNGWDVFVCFYAKKDYRLFTNGPDSFWKIFLTTESGQDVKPLSVEAIPMSPYVQVMFPYINRWSKTYRVTFPKVALGDEYQLTLQSVVGSSTLTWRTIEAAPRSRSEKLQQEQRGASDRWKKR